MPLGFYVFLSILIICSFFLVHIKRRNETYLKKLIDISSLSDLDFQDVFQGENVFEESIYENFYLNNITSKVFRCFLKKENNLDFWVYLVSLKVVHKQASTHNAFCFIVDTKGDIGKSLVITKLDNKSYFSRKNNEKLLLNLDDKDYRVFGKSLDEKFIRKVSGFVNENLPIYFEIQKDKLLIVYSFSKIESINIKRLYLNVCGLIEK
ncbi:hypothetical protein [Agarilytica rhodophyticola]|uniref:hypothetical protein n=1 Tax=Agarilytica rhodophyticola TaxID=1737490 RepID=UPI000B348DC4|nr:hypothetical protein [Agarilytica rhodophyticola]